MSQRQKLDQSGLLFFDASFAFIMPALRRQARVDSFEHGPLEGFTLGALVLCSAGNKTTGQSAYGDILQFTFLHYPFHRLANIELTWQQILNHRQFAVSYPSGFDIRGVWWRVSPVLTWLGFAWSMEQTFDTRPIIHPFISFAN